MIAPYSILHFLVDGLCAFAMFGPFATRENWYLNVLLYNFCAFALQMPMGAVLDILNGRRGLQKYEFSFVFAIVGVLLTVLGALTHPVILGVGNALFHLGGGVGSIQEDEARDWHGRGLGVFVAPGALGLYLGTQLAKGKIPLNISWVILIGVSAIFCLRWCYRVQTSREILALEVVASSDKKEGSGILIGCLLVVILRSYIGMSVEFSWKSTLFAGMVAVLAIVLGKMAGGFVSAWAGMRRTVVLSLLLSSLCYVFSENMVTGVLALFFFNMTMPITLYLLVQKLKGLVGFSFGVLTFGLFLGFLPTYLGVQTPMDGRVLGCMGSLVSLVILWFCVKKQCKK